MTLAVGLNPYGLTYTLGLQGDAGTGLDGFLEIAEEIGVSQMHVSRLLARTLSWLRNRLETEAPPEPDEQPAE